MVVPIPMVMSHFGVGFTELMGDDWIINMWYIYTTGFYSVVNKDPFCQRGVGVMTLIILNSDSSPYLQIISLADSEAWNLTFQWSLNSTSLESDYGSHAGKCCKDCHGTSGDGGRVHCSEAFRQCLLTVLPPLPTSRIWEFFGRSQVLSCPELILGSAFSDLVNQFFPY